MAKLAHTSESVIAIAFLVLNLAKILWLCLHAAVIGIVCQWLTDILILSKWLSCVAPRGWARIGTA